MPSRSNRRGAQASNNTHLSTPTHQSASLKPNQAGAGAMQNDGEDSDDTQKGEHKTRGAILQDQTKQEMLQPPPTPTTTSAKHFARMQIGDRQNTKTTLDYDAVEEKYADLLASGWRPEEELASVADDDDYEGIDSISQSDDDETAICRFEADSLVNRQDARRLSLHSEDLEEEWHGFDDPLTPRIDPVTGVIFGGAENEPASFLLNDTRTGDQVEQDRKRGNGNNAKAVRFDVDSSASSGESDSDDEYNDLYLFSQVSQLGFGQQNTFDDIMDEDGGSDAGSVWDFDRDEVLDEAIDDSDDYSSDASANSSGYDSDDDELTDEEEPVPIPASMNASMTSLEDNVTPSKAQVTPVTTPIVTKRNNTTQSKSKPLDADVIHKPKQPKMGTFQVDPRRPRLVVSGAGPSQRNQLVAARIQTPAEKLFWIKMKNSSVMTPAKNKTTVQLDPADEMDLAEDGSLFGPGSPFPSLRNTDIQQEYIGPLSAFHPFTDIDATGTQITDHTMHSVTEDDDHDMAAMSPFVNWDNFDQDDEDDSQDTSDVLVEYSPRKRANTMPMPATPSSAGTAPTPSLSRRSTMTSDQGEEPLSHLNRDSSLVNAFRMNQHYVRHYTSYAAHPSTRASTLEANAMQSGRRKWGNTPITPLRKKRGGSLGKIGKLDWTKGLVDETPASIKSSPAQFKRPVSAGNGMSKRGSSRQGFSR